MSGRSIPVREERSLWVLDKVYQWKHPRLGWNDPQQELLGIKMQYHSRFDAEHYNKCNDCYDAHLDFEDECRMDAMADAAAEREDYDY